MKLSHEEKFWLNLVDFVDKNTKSMTVAYFDKHDTYNVASRLQIEFIEAITEAILNKIIQKCKKGKLTDNELKYLRRVLILMLKENSKNKKKWPPMLIEEL